MRCPIATPNYHTSQSGRRRRCRAWCSQSRLFETIVVQSRRQTITHHSRHREASLSSLVSSQSTPLKRLLSNRDAKLPHITVGSREASLSSLVSSQSTPLKRCVVQSRRQTITSQSEPRGVVVELGQPVHAFLNDSLSNRDANYHTSQPVSRRRCRAWSAASPRL